MRYDMFDCTYLSPAEHFLALVCIPVASDTPATQFVVMM